MDLNMEDGFVEEGLQLMEFRCTFLIGADTLCWCLPYAQGIFFCSMSCNMHYGMCVSVDI